MSEQDPLGRLNDLMLKLLWSPLVADPFLSPPYTSGNNNIGVIAMQQRAPYLNVSKTRVGPLRDRDLPFISAAFLGVGPSLSRQDMPRRRVLRVLPKSFYLFVTHVIGILRVHSPQSTARGSDALQNTKFVVFVSGPFREGPKYQYSRLHV